MKAFFFKSWVEFGVEGVVAAHESENDDQSL